TGKGYRAPQAFDSDMHIAFAGGGISRIQLHQNLKPEISTSISGGIFYHTISNRMLFDFSIEAFYNKIDKVFILEEILNTNINQQILEKRNGNLDVVNELTCSSILNLNKKIEAEFSVTAQKSLYQKPVAWSGE